MTFEDYSTAIQSAAFRMNLFDFCAALGWAEDGYAKEKFLQFQQLASDLQKFDPDTLEKIVMAGRTSIR